MWQFQSTIIVLQHKYIYWVWHILLSAVNFNSIAFCISGQVFIWARSVILTDIYYVHATSGRRQAFQDCKMKKQWRGNQKIPIWNAVIKCWIMLYSMGHILGRITSYHVSYSLWFMVSCYTNNWSCCNILQRVAFSKA